jgi:competence protein ComEC
MINITFKDVGQGDSIIIEWNDDNKKGLGIIDCNIYQEQNKVLNYISIQKITEIEFIILSHPHYDHFSGMYELLEYCKNNKIHIKYFIHTCSSVPDFLKSAVKGIFIQTELHKMFRFIKDNYTKMNLGVFSVQSDSPTNYLPLSKNYKLIFLSPSYKEITESITKSDFNEETSGNNPKANHLATIVKLETQEGYALFTSDAPKSALIRMDKRTPEELKNKLLLGQGPHHGAKSNHNNAFWKKRNRDVQTPIVFSVGTNGYGHVSSEAVNFFSKNDYAIFSTNTEGALKSTFSRSISLSLNAFSVLKTPKHNNLQGDQSFFL